MDSPRTRASACVILILGACVLGSGWVTARSPYGEGVELGRLSDPRLKELSGLAASGRRGDLFFAHNDSGDGPNVYALNRRGETVALLRVKGAAALDWEDMAAGPGANGQPSLYLGDIGDNFRARPMVSVYRIPEPTVDLQRRDLIADTASATRFDLQYPEGPQDSETLLVHPKTGQLLLITKSRQGSAVYAAPLPLRAGAPNRLRRVAEIVFSKFPASEGAKRDPTGALLATGGAISPAGDRVVVRTYTDAHEWKIAADDVGGAFRGEAVHIPLPPLPAGEAITYTRDGEALVVGHEGAKAPLFELRRSPGLDAGARDEAKPWRP